MTEGIELDMLRSITSSRSCKGRTWFVSTCAFDIYASRELGTITIRLWSPITPPMWQLVVLEFAPVTFVCSSDWQR